ncbi:DUF1847 domain-containing protein [Eubacteriaceae bacterium ES2]|nr:DUF1847 domain-containing protein [Eubacteriaceae bacterium ES2]
MSKEKELSCIDCAVVNCIKRESKFPDFCPTIQTVAENDLTSVKKIYREDENQKSMIAAAEVEMEGYGRLTRVEEIMEYARKMNATKLGIATCAGLISESRILAKIFRHHGFEVYGLSCKIGCIKKTEINIPKECEDFSPHTCNPILQAKLLNEAKTDLNVVVGLCVGHDSLFYKYSDALVTTAVTKDRVLGHNPAAVLYTANFYYQKKLFPEN